MLCIFLDYCWYHHLMYAFRDLKLAVIAIVLVYPSLLLIRVLNKIHFIFYGKIIKQLFSFYNCCCCWILLYYMLWSQIKKQTKNRQQKIQITSETNANIYVTWKDMGYSIKKSFKQKYLNQQRSFDILCGMHENKNRLKINFLKFRFKTYWNYGFT